jgi:flagellar L-ring protein FlgH
MTMMKRSGYLVASLLSLSLLSGCAFNQAKPNDPAFAPVAPSRMMPPVAENGAIYQAGFARDLFEDQQARRVGDMLTIVLQEAYNSNKNATTNTTKSSEIDVPASTTILGKTPKVAGQFTPATSIESEQAFSGTANVVQNNKLTGTITVTVSDVLPNGNLIIRGEKWLTLNRGEEYVRLTGIVRPQDIAADNSVLSTRIADARISYSGTGEIADTNSMGWLTRFFTSAMFPF